MSLIWNPEESATILEMPLEVIKVGTQDMGNGIYWLKAGTPLDEYFAVSNDEDAKYIVAEDFKFISTKPEQAKIVPLITAGYVDLNKAEAASGLTYTDDCIAALGDAGIVLVDGVISTGGGGGGGLAPMTVTISRRSLGEDEYDYTADKTVDEMIEQIEAGGQLFAIFSWFGMGSPVMFYQVTEELKGVAFFVTMANSYEVETLSVNVVDQGSGDVIVVNEYVFTGGST